MQLANLYENGGCSNRRHEHNPKTIHVCNDGLRYVVLESYLNNSETEYSERLIQTIPADSKSLSLEPSLISTTPL